MPRSLLQQKSINQQSITPGTEVGVLDFSVNSAAVDGKYEDGSVVLRTGSSVNPAGAFTGGGTGNKAILGTESNRIKYGLIFNTNFCRCSRKS